MDGILYDDSDFTPDPNNMPVRMPNDIPVDMIRGAQLPQSKGVLGRIGDFASNAVDKTQQFAQANPGLLMAAAAGIGKGTPMGDMAASIQEHYKLQDVLKQKKDATAAMLKLQGDKLDEAKRLNSSKIDANTAKALKDGTAKVSVVGNGVIAVTPPGATSPTLMTSEEYQAFGRELQGMRNDNSLLIAGINSDLKPKTAAQLEQEAQARKGLNDTGAQINKYRTTLAMLEEKGAPGLAALPGIQVLNQMAGGDASEMLRHLNELKVDEAFANKAVGQGAITDFERGILLGPMPHPAAAYSVWESFIKDRLTALEKLEAYRQSEVERTANPEKVGVATAKKLIADRANPAPKTYQQYPPGFNPPNKGFDTNPQGRLDILNQEHADALAMDPKNPQKPALVAAAEREVKRAGGSPAAATGPAKYSPADAKAAIAAGKLKPGDTFIGLDGKTRTVH